MTLSPRPVRLILFSVFVAVFAIGCGKGADRAQRADASVATTNAEPVWLGYLQNLRAHRQAQQPRKFEPRGEIAKLDHDDPEYVVAWNLSTTVDDYQTFGRKKSRWDGHVIEAMTRYAEMRAAAGDLEKHDGILPRLRKAVAAAKSAGCEDPLVEYLHVRYGERTDDEMDRDWYARAFGRVAVEMEKSDYSPIRKFYPHLRAAEAVKTQARYGTMPEVLWEYRMGAIHHLNAALLDPNMPPQEAAQNISQLWATCKINKGSRKEIEAQLLATLSNHWNDRWFTHLLKGNILMEKAWDARGGGWADTVTPDGWKVFYETLEPAEEALRHAWSLDKNQTETAVAMISICTARNHPRAEMEKWFHHAMAIEPGHYPAIQYKAMYLEPKWHGSAEEALKFGRECVASTEWKGKAPLILFHLHEAIAKHQFREDPAGLVRYWRRPEVWKDVRASYEKYLELHPDDWTRRHEFARHAYSSAQHEVLLQQVSKLGNDVDQEYFGGKKAYREMIATAQSKTAQSQ